jgi:hypothetical protein
MLKMIEQGAVTTPQIEHTRAGRYPVGNLGEVRPQAMTIEGTLSQIHGASPVAIRSK